MGTTSTPTYRFVTKIRQRVRNMSLDFLTSVLLRAVVALWSTTDEEPYLGLISASAITLGDQGFKGRQNPKGTRRTSSPQIRTLPVLYGRSRVSARRTTARGDFIVVPFPPPLSTRVSLCLQGEDAVPRPRAGQPRSTPSFGPEHDQVSTKESRVLTSTKRVKVQLGQGYLDGLSDEPFTTFS